jgi:DNA polymerase III epsilon subunit-like protein
MTTIIFDTETTGLPRNKWRGALQGPDNWPDLVSICWLVYDNDWELVRKEYHVVRPEGWTIPAESSAIHGITQAVAAASGEPLAAVLGRFAEDLKTAGRLVAHNMAFDKNVVQGAFKWRLGVEPAGFWPAVEFCTMEASREILRLPWKGVQHPGKPLTYKPPRLSELWSYAFQGTAQPPAHNSEGDALATAAIYMKMWGY